MSKPRNIPQHPGQPSLVGVKVSTDSPVSLIERALRAYSIGKPFKLNPIDWVLGERRPTDGVNCPRVQRRMRHQRRQRYARLY